ncbi:MAG: hypothetical protein GQ570_05185 [Helicobacteraceae bacterium]|nr:hypothetical protein [Helicobacteraceae bacterium]
MISPWKMLGGVAVGVGAVAAAPFTGGGSLLAGSTVLASLAGAGTVAAAVGVGAVGAGIGAKLSHDEEQEKQKLEDAIAKQAAQTKQAEQALNDMIPKFTSQEDYFNLVKAMTAVGIACANCDGEIVEAERADIDEFISGLSGANLPDYVKKDIEYMYANPPRLRLAFDMVKKVPSESFDFFDQIVDITISSDNVEHEKEKEFKQDWEQLKRMS